jgi:pimeloyl-ACP methyl ester carboxylesterase
MRLFRWIIIALRIGAAADSGFRVVRYDYYGRGRSDRVDAAYDQDLFVRQLAGLLDSLRVAGPVDLAGL